MQFDEDDKSAPPLIFEMLGDCNRNAALAKKKSDAGVWNKTHEDIVARTVKHRGDAVQRMEQIEPATGAVSVYL